MTLQLSKHEQLVLVERDILLNQQTIDQCMDQLVSMREEAGKLIEQASRALEQRDRLLKKVEEESLWADDFDNVDEYYDSIGLSRQRSKQIRDRVTISQIVNSVDGVFPPVSDLHARHLSRLGNPQLVVRVFSVASQEVQGEPPSPARVGFLVDAALQGIAIEDGQALQEYQEAVLVDRCYTLYQKLSTYGRNLLRQRMEQSDAK